MKSPRLSLKKERRYTEKRKKMHLLVVVAERVGDAQLGNIHQSRLSIPGVATKNNKKNN